MRNSVLALAAVLLVAPPPPQDNSSQTFRAGVEIVHVDVSVLDANRQPVRGLTAADFTLLEDGKPRPIVAFTPVDIPAPPSDTGTAAWVDQVSPDVATNELPREGRLVVIMFDQSIRNAHRAIARRVAKAAVEALGPADLAAIVHSGVGTSQDFTRDRSLLFSAIDAPAMGFADGEEMLASDPGGRSSSLGSNPGLSPPLRARGRCPLGKCTLETITRIAESLRDLPRRKSLLLIAPQVTIQDVDSDIKRLREKMFRAVDVANLTIYPVDPVGLETLALDASVPSGARPSPNRTGVMQNQLARLGTLTALAERTGGLALLNSNDPDALVAATFTESSAYYSLGFESADRDNKGRFHEIEVRVNRRDVSIHSRRGHYAGVAAAGPTAAVVGPPPDLVTAVSAGWPKADIRIAIAASAFADPAGSRPVAAITVTAPAAGTQLRVLVAAFDTNGRSINHHWQRLDLAGIERSRSTVDVLSRLPLEPGRYQIRAAVTNDDGRAGSVFTYLEVPDFSKAPLSMSGIAAEVLPARLSAPDGAFEGLLPIVPTPRRDLLRTDAMNAFVRLYQGGKDPLEPVLVIAGVRDARGRAVVEKREAMAAARFTNRRTADYRVELSMETLEPGAYLLTIEAARRNDTVRRDVRFTVQ